MKYLFSLPGVAYIGEIGPSAFWNALSGELSLRLACMNSMLISDSSECIRLSVHIFGMCALVVGLRALIFWVPAELITVAPRECGFDTKRPLDGSFVCEQLHSHD